MAAYAIRCGVGLALLPFGGCDDDAVTLPELSYVLAVALETTSVELGALQFEVEFLGEDGGFGGIASCAWVVNATLQACNARSSHTLKCAVVDTEGFAGPSELVECEFVSRESDLTVSDFEARVVDASTPYLEPVDADVSLELALRSAETTTTTDPDNPPVEYDVAFGAGEELGTTLESVELKIAPTGARGGWIGSGNDVDCRWLVAADSSFCLGTPDRIVECLAADPDGFAADGVLLECGFASSDPVVVTGDFWVFAERAIQHGGGVVDRFGVTPLSVTPR